MNKRTFNKVMSTLYKQRYIFGTWMRLMDRYSLFCTCDGSQWDTHGKCVDEEWCIDIEYNYHTLGPIAIYKGEQYRKSYQDWFETVRDTLKREVPNVEVYCVNSDSYRLIEIV